MLNTTETANTDLAIIETTEAVEVVSQQSEMSEKEALQQVAGFDFAGLDGMEESVELTAQVKENWADGEVSKVVFVMNKTLTNRSGQSFPAVMLTDGKNSYLLAAIMAVQAIKDLAPGTPICITYLGSKPAAQGKQKMFSVRVLRKSHQVEPTREAPAETIVNGENVEPTTEPTAEAKKGKK